MNIKTMLPDRVTVFDSSDLSSPCGCITHSRGDEYKPDQEVDRAKERETGKPQISQQEEDDDDEYA